MDGIYLSLFSVLQQYIYGLGTELTPDMSLTLTLLSTLGSVFIVSVPFLLVWKVVKSL